jgi:hypothetical protein
MIQVIEPGYSFGSEMGKSLGEGIGRGANFAIQLGMQRAHQKKVNKYFSDLKEKHPGEKNYEVLADIAASPLSEGQKGNFLKSLLNVDPYRAEQQERLKKVAISQQYNNAIKELDSAIEKRIYPYGSDEHKQAVDLRHRLTQERDHLLGLGMMEPGSEESEGLEELEEEIPQKRNGSAVKKRPKRQKFDPANPKHKAQRDEVLKKTGGDKKKAGMVLSKEFDL